MSSAVPSTPLRPYLDERLAEIAAELERRFASETEAIAANAAETARRAAGREIAEQLNQAVRRLHRAAGAEALLAALAESSRPYCQWAAIFSITNSTVRGRILRGPEREGALAEFAKLEFPAREAAAFGAVIESWDPVVSLASANDVSAPVQAFFGHSADERAHLFPIFAGEDEMAVLYATAVSEPACLELLAQVAGACFAAPAALPAEESVGMPEATLVQISPAASAPEGGSGWESMDAAQRETHLRAQRFARVQVAEMRLYRAEAVTAGRQRRELYAQLASEIDRAREAFRVNFVRTCPGMADYLHQELVRTLANDDVLLLGKDYPGPLV